MSANKKMQTQTPEAERHIYGIEFSVLSLKKKKIDGVKHFVVPFKQRTELAFKRNRGCPGVERIHLCTHSVSCL